MKSGVEPQTKRKTNTRAEETVRKSGRPVWGRSLGVGGRPLRTPEGHARVCDLSSEYKGKPSEGTFDLLVCMLTCQKISNIYKTRENSMKNPHCLIA